MCDCDRDIDPNKLACEVLYKAIENHVDFLYGEDRVSEAETINDGLETANNDYYKNLFTLLTLVKPLVVNKKAVKK